ncbi:Crp/Fnr family transcriptional regulator [Sphingobacterium sp. DR205]|uniref:Crp/Fnr family transcriptional regulator n=1 Tax=Sphingobacterium sp. DR205 TaxID=2713573 RepID=UPI0013E500C6|nr:Crp/Fnr family transcriptional regulator [Sphingobacterium sp. DR205]QIH35931.1 Crp/Fnr family transcriptional regulator [Sphingobacterium sp. DR205]
MSFKRYRRGELIFKVGERVDTIALLVEGAVYSDFYDEDGNQRITSFHCPLDSGEIVFNYEDYLQERPSQKSYKAFGDSLLLLLDISAVKVLYDRFPRFYQLELMIMQPNLIHALKNISILQARTAAEKIALLKEHSPKTFQVFPYSYIASFLGIHRNTLNAVLTTL